MNDSCLCQRCGQRYKVDVILSDDLWRKLTGRADGSGLLCGMCILARIENLGAFGAFKLVRAT